MFLPLFHELKTNYINFGVKTPSFTDGMKRSNVGIDFGLKTYITFSNGERLAQPQYLKNNLTELRKLSRNHSKKQRGSNN